MNRADRDKLNDELLTPGVLEARWKVSRRTLANYAKRHGLKTVQLPGGTRYRVSDVLEFERRVWRPAKKGSGQKEPQKEEKDGSLR